MESGFSGRQKLVTRLNQTELQATLTTRKFDDFITVVHHLSAGYCTLLQHMVQRVLVSLHLPVVENVQIARIFIDEVGTDAGVVAGRPDNPKVWQ